MVGKALVRTIEIAGTIAIIVLLVQCARYYGN